MEVLEQIFNNLDNWRHLPDYQLERRADIFFSAFLPQILNHKTGKEINKVIIPEFPIRIGTIYPDKPINMSYKIDYFAVDKTGTNAYFIELKTDMKSRNKKQDNYLQITQQTDLTELLQGILTIYEATNYKRKYMNLLLQLEKLNLITIPTKIKNNLTTSLPKTVRNIETKSRVKNCEVFYIQPRGKEKNVINFNTISNYLSNLNDPIANRFANSLTNWSKYRAGDSKF